MKSPIWDSLAVAGFAAATLAFLPSIAKANDFANEAEIALRKPHAPVEPLRCESGANVYQESIHFVNRSRHGLIAATIELRFYDSDGTLIAKARAPYEVNPVVSSGERGVINVLWNPAGGYPNSLSFMEPTSAISKATCAIVAAQFTGMKTWSSQVRWTEPLVTDPEDQSSSQDQSSSGDDIGNTPDEALDGSSGRSASRPAITLSVSNAWNDTVQGSLFIHTALEIHGGSSDETLTPDMLTLSLKLANGGKRNYGASAQVAPTYQKISALSSTPVVTNEVDRKEDLGALGSLIIPANGTVHIVATFFIGSDILADPNANRQVTLR
jgi:hypothetical protein